MQQMSLFDALRKPRVKVSVDPDGHVVQGEPDAVYRLEHPRMAWDRAAIELHRHENGLWMWSASWMCDTSGGGYKVGAKWGNFAETQDDALFYAVCEIEDGLKNKTSADALLILKWAGSLKARAAA